MGPLRHLTCGAILGTAIMLSERDALKAVSCVCGATMCDIDHIIEYAKYCNDYNAKPSFAEWKSGEYFNTKGTVCVLFHSWEVCLLMWLLKGHTGSRIIDGLRIGYTSHLILDQIGNNLNKWSYFWLYRWWKDFNQPSLKQ